MKSTSTHSLQRTFRSTTGSARAKREAKDDDDMTTTPPPLSRRLPQQAHRTGISPARLALRRPSLTISIIWLSLSYLLITLTISGVQGEEEISFEVAQRVRERLEDYMQDPSTIARLLVRYRLNSRLDHNMRARNRNAFLTLNDALMRVVPRFIKGVYFGLEDGTFVGTFNDASFYHAKYREPGESGFSITDPTYKKHVNTCVNETGHPVECVLVPGNAYIQCVDNCSLHRCSDEESQRDCHSAFDFPTNEKMAECEEKVKWCKHYVQKSAPEQFPSGISNNSLGFIPRTSHCIDSTGVVSQTPGQIVQKKDTDALGNCYYMDGVTMVNRTETGPYACCGKHGEVCSDTFVGRYQHEDYDPRWRGWYKRTKDMQLNNWSPAYPFFTNLDMGITYSEPIYSIIEGKNVFAGVIAVDYTLENINEFLVENYLDSSEYVAIFEDVKPYYMIGSSTGSKVARIVMKADHAQACPDTYDSGKCTAIRISMSDLKSVSDVSMDTMMSEAFDRQRSASFPTAEVVTVKANNSGSLAVYASHTQLFELVGADLSWRIIILNPVSPSSGDAILPGDLLFGAMIATGALGFIVCLSLLLLFYKKRLTRAVMASDWRFTSAFLLGGTLLNTVAFSFLGPNTDGLCLLRMWLPHFFFALAFSPLLVKTWRMMKLCECSQNYTRVRITHRRVALLCIPIVLVQIIILSLFSVIDPSKQSEIIENSNWKVSYRIVCDNDSKAFFITQLVFEGGLVLLGCVLAFKTRHLRGSFGEAKQLIICMYDIALVGSVVVFVEKFVGGGQAEKRMLQAIGVFWGTVFSSCVFVVPRLIQMKATVPISGVSAAQQS